MNNVKELMERAGLQRKELASLCNVSLPTITDWCKGRKNPSGRNLQKLTEIFNVPNGVILGYDPAPRIDAVIGGFSASLEYPYTEEDHRILTAYHQLTKTGKEYIRQQLAIAQKIYRESDSIPVLESIG